VSTPDVVTAEAPAFLPAYFGTLDERPREVMPMLAPGFAFSFLWSDEGGPREFAGGLDDFNGYMAQREPDGQAHHIDVGIRDGEREVVLGHTTRYGERLGTFTFAVWLDGEGRAERLYSGRTLAFGDAGLAPPEGSETGPATLLPDFLGKLDDSALDVLPMLSPDLRFAILWSEERGVNEFVGGHTEYDGYLAQREPEGQRHHLVATARAGRSEVSLGYTTRWGEELGTFMMFMQADEHERARLFFAARSLVFSGIWSD
jgi:hypothetical protein